VVVTDEPLNEFAGRGFRLFSRTENAAIPVTAYDITFEILNAGIEPVISFKIELAATGNAPANQLIKARPQ
jgi:hypothetical protein